MNTLQKKKRSYDTVSVNVDGLCKMVAPALATPGTYRVIKRDDITSVRSYGNQGLIKAGTGRAKIVEPPDSSSVGHVFLQGSFLLSTVLLGHGMDMMKMSDSDESTRPIRQSFDAPLLLAACENDLQTMMSFERQEAVEAPPEFQWSRDKYRARVAAAEFGKSINADY